MSGATRLLATLGSASLAFAVWALATGSLTALSLLVACFVLLWAGATVRHASRATRGPLAV